MLLLVWVYLGVRYDAAAFFIRREYFYSEFRYNSTSFGYSYFTIYFQIVSLSHPIPLICCCCCCFGLAWRLRCSAYERGLVYHFLHIHNFPAFSPFDFFVFYSFPFASNAVSALQNIISMNIIVVFIYIFFAVISLCICNPRFFCSIQQHGKIVKSCKSMLKYDIIASTTNCIAGIAWITFHICCIKKFL